MTVGDSMQTVWIVGKIASFINLEHFAFAVGKCPSNSFGRERLGLVHDGTFGEIN